MLRHAQNLGRSLMVPVSVLPAAAILMGLGYWIDPVGWGSESVVAALFLASGGALINNMGILFAVGVAYGLSRDKNGAAALAGLVAWLMIQTLLDPSTVSLLTGTPVEEVNAAFSSIDNQFIGIVCGIVAAIVYNYTYKTELPIALSFFSGRRLSIILTSGIMILVSLVFLFAWPFVYTGLVAFGEVLVGMGALGAGLFGFFNRLLIPFGLHHALNSVFWFDVAGINDIPNYLSGQGEPGVTGMYQAGFFPIMMFGLPAAALAMYQEARDAQKDRVKGLFIGGATASFFVGITEPLEFAFLFVAPGLFLWHAFLTGTSLFVSAKMEWIAGFGFSAGFIDYVLSFKNPLAVNNHMLIFQGIVYGIIYYVSFRFFIRKFNIMTPGRNPEDDDIIEYKEEIGSNKHAVKAEKIVAIIGADNIVNVDNCATRLRLEVKNSESITKEDIIGTGAIGLMKPSNTAIQIIIGPDVEFVADELKKLV